MKRSASLALVIQSLRPSMTNASPSSRACVCSANASLPDAASERRRRRRLGGERRQQSRFHVRAAPAEQGIHDQRVLDVDEHADRRIHARQLLDDEDRMEERAAAPPWASGISMPMTPSSNSWSISARGIFAQLVHLADVRPDLSIGEFPDARTQQLLVFAQVSERQRRSLGRLGGHGRMLSLRCPAPFEGTHASPHCPLVCRRARSWRGPCRRARPARPDGEPSAGIRSSRRSARASTRSASTSS